MKKAYFYGNEVSEYGVEHGRVDFRCFAKAFDAVLNNTIMSATADIGYWEPVSGSEEYYEDHAGTVYNYDEAQERIEELEVERDALQEQIDELDENEPDDGFSDEEQAKRDALQKKIDELEADIDWLNDAHYDEVFQWFIVSDNAVSLLEEANQIVYYNEALDMYVWGVTHWGTSWDYVLTCIPCHIYED